MQPVLTFGNLARTVRGRLARAKEDMEGSDEAALVALGKSKHPYSKEESSQRGWYMELTDIVMLKRQRRWDFSLARG